MKSSKFKWIAVTAGAVSVLLGCASDKHTDRAQKASAAVTQKPAAAATAREQSVVESVHAWEYEGNPGQIITTEHYRLFTTQDEPVLIDRLPLFVELAMQRYRVGITGGDHPLPPPPRRLDTFVMKTRPEWASLTKRLLRQEGEPFLKIPRGGFAWSGTALLFDIGTQDTMAIAAHEGWHQYTQRTFAQSLPVWLEEGIAVYMEGHRWGGPAGQEDGVGGGVPVFMGWANVERFDQLRAAAGGGQNRIMPLEALLDSSPAGMLAGGGEGDALTYYAQLWALVHFLREGEGGKYREALEKVVSEAAEGKLSRTLVAVLGPERTLETVQRKRGTGVFVAYFNRDVDAASREYARFVEEIVKPGARGPVVDGKSPLDAPTSK